MSSKKVTFGQPAREKMIKGVDMLADAVSITLGPKGRNVVIEKSFGGPKITKDGISVAKEIQFSDKLENLGAQLIKSVASQAADRAGDGTTTTTILARAVLKRGNKYVVTGMNPVDIKIGIDLAAKSVVEYIKSISKKVSSSEETAQVATISANGDSEMGNKIAEAIKEVGGAPITVEEGQGVDGIGLDIVKGMHFDKGYLSTYFATNREKMTAELEKPYILLFDGKISSLQQILQLLQAVAQTGKPLFIIADDVEGEALTALAVNNLRGTLKVVAIKAPGFGDRKKATLDDIAVLTGCQVVSEEIGMKLENITVENLGSARRVSVTKDNTTIVDGAGSKDDVAERCKQIDLQIEESKSDYDKEKLEERKGKLSGGVAVLTVGGGSEVEVKERRDRVDDALNATRAAMEEGVVPGGGITLLYAKMILDKVKGANEEQNAGIDIVKGALEAPIRKIMQNAGLDPSVIVGKLLSQSSQSYGYNARSMEYCDMYKAGITDPAKVVRVSVQTAASVASTFLTSEVAITENPDDKNAFSKGSDESAAGMF
ncbi:MAG: chaperonin GroEL [Alphaproteobacteria bacterium]|nr:chaperonin GroEL [Rickettsiales bacterium]